MAIADLLKGCPLFHELYDREIEKIVKNCSVLNFQKGDTIIREGDESNVLYVMLDGSAMIEKSVPDGRVAIAPLNQGDVFGEMILLDERIRSADIVAESICHVLEIHYDQIFQLFKKEPGVFGLMMLNLSRLLSRRVRSANQIIEQLSKKNKRAA